MICDFFIMLVKLTARFNELAMKFVLKNFNVEDGYFKMWPEKNKQTGNYFQGMLSNLVHGTTTDL